MLKVCETFRSISGESSWQGLPATFIRFQGCDVDCEWCDTKYARETAATDCTIGDLVSICGANRIGRVILTGGEPLLQEELPVLCMKLLQEGFHVQVETSGTRLVNVLPEHVMKVIDIKPPSAKAKKGFHWGNLDCLGERDEIKFVLADRDDYEWAVRIIRKTGLEKRGNLLFSPVTERLAPSELAAWIVEDCLECRLQLQIHKLIWPSVERGK